MPELTVDASVAIDLASKDDIERHHRWLEKRLGDFQVEDRTLSATVTTSLPQFFRLGSPPAGKIYVTNWATLFPNNAIAIPTGVDFILAVGSYNTTVPDSDVVAGYVPVGYTNLRKIICRGGQEFYGVVFGTGTLTGATRLTVNVGVEVWPDSAEARRHL